MRILALQTDLDELKKQFVAEGEEVLHSTAHHFLAFFLTIIGKTILFALVVAAIVSFFAFSPSMWALAIGVVVLTILSLIYAYHFIKAYVGWKYNFIVVTTEKVVVITHNAMIYQHVNPIHIDNIASSRFESQFWGIFPCGILHISLKERTEGSTKEVTVPYVPHPEVVSGIIENAVVLAAEKVKTEGEGKEALAEKVEAVKEKAAESSDGQGLSLGQK